MADPISLIAQLLGVPPALVAGYVPLIILIANLISRLIPDDATGPLGLIQKITKVIGLYASNRISSQMSLNDVAKATVSVSPQVEEIAKLPDPGDQLAVNDYEKQGRDRFLPDEFKTILMVFMLAPLLLLSACATDGTKPGVASTAIQMAKTACYNREAMQFILNQVKPNPAAEKVQPLLDYLHTYCPVFFSQVDPELFKQTLTDKRVDLHLYTMVSEGTHVHATR